MGLFAVLDPKKGESAPRVSILFYETTFSFLLEVSSGSLTDQVV